jgi:hypothetical protein
MQSKPSIQVLLLTLAALGLLAVIFYTPIWWVSLTAPNYPPESFPDGVKIHFQLNGVFNGCQIQQKAEIAEQEALDCVHEMDTINHYVGMYPIAAGGPLERGFSQFLMAFLAVMLLGFACTRPRLRLLILGLGFAGITLWMTWTVYLDGGLRLQNRGYLSALLTSLDQEAGADSVDDTEVGIGGIAGLLRQSLEDSGVQVELPSEIARRQALAQDQGMHKQHLIDQLRATYDIDQAKSSELTPWNGTTFQVMSWHYAKSLGRYFNNPAEIAPRVAKLELAIHILFWVLIGAMLLLLWGARHNRGVLYWLLVLLPMALPLFFLIDYSAWLWWYGHTLNDMGAFSVKPFMPTVFGDGKVAQFTTHSYPAFGFGLMLLFSLLLGVAALIRARQFKGKR